MDAENINAEFAKFQQQNAGFDCLLVLSRDGAIIHSSDPKFANAEEAKNLMDAWLHNKPAVEVGGARYPILKWDELQFAARNTSGKGAIVGCICKSKNFAITHIAPNTNSNLIVATVALNRWSWSLI